MLGWLVCLVFVNAFTLLLKSMMYICWTIRSRYKMLYFVHRKDIYLTKAENAADTATFLIKWIRPTALVLINCFMSYTLMLTIGQN